MKTLATAIALAAFAATPAAAQSCYDLWYARNLIYAQNGYCFNTDLGRRAFAEYPCWTSNPALSRSEQRQVDAIRAQERARGCKVNN